MSKHFIAFLLLFSSIHLLVGQDIHLSQYYTSNLSFNPGRTGDYHGDLKASWNYRNQWKQVNQPIETNMASIEKKINLNKDALGVGLLFINDRSGNIGLTTNKIMASFAYEHDLKGNLFRAGIQAGYVQNSNNLNNQLFPNQWDYKQGDFDTEIFNEEKGLTNSYSNLDLNAGFTWSKQFQKIRPTIGYSLLHINKPKNKFTENNNDAFNHLIDVKANYKLNTKTTIIPKALYMLSAKAENILISSHVQYAIANDLKPLLGLGVRTSRINGDAYIIYLGIQYKQFDLGLSTDRVFSSLNDGEGFNQKSSFEISLSYTTPSFVPESITIPCDRY